MASKTKKSCANYFALLETDDPGDTRLEQPQAAPANLTQELFGRAYPSASEIMRNRRQQKPQYSSAPPANTKAGARADSSKKGAQGQAQAGSSTRKQQLGGRGHANGAAVDGNKDAPAPRLYDPGEFPSLK